MWVLGTSQYRCTCKLKISLRMKIPLLVFSMVLGKIAPGKKCLLEKMPPGKMPPRKNASFIFCDQIQLITQKYSGIIFKSSIVKPSFGCSAKYKLSLTQSNDLICSIFIKSFSLQLLPSVGYTSRLVG